MRSFAFILSLLLCCLLSSKSWAGRSEPSWRPPSFDVAQLGGRAVFVDFLSADSQIELDNERDETRVLTEIDFQMPERGLPIFDLVEDVLSVSLDGQPVIQSEINSPDKATRFRIVNRVVEPGSHHLTIESRITKGVKYHSKDLSFRFSFDDMADRGFLEKYLPTNFEYDHYSMTFTVRALGSGHELRLFANGEVESLGRNEWRISFPDFYTCSSPYLDLDAADDFKVLEDAYQSPSSGRVIPITVYKHRGTIGDLDKFMRIAKESLAKLEIDLGDFPYPRLLVHAIMGLPRTGMEYAGAAETMKSVLPHEIFHSYFARGLMPANGDAGWIDEALAMWFEHNYPRLKDPEYDSYRFAGVSPYRREATHAGYWKGKRFMAYLNERLQPQGGLLAFLRILVRDRMYESLTTESFEAWLEAWSGQSFRADFDRYVYGI